ncbi:hypothetical protein GQ42DRAFT_160767 [Ramicandelaber brevisporus]|nr:hypothetical protein GQ42DRAFT_160767 [Ramicandelaber brevisporus]
MTSQPTADGLLVIEQSFVRVLLEQVKNTVRLAQRAIERDLQVANQALSELANPSGSSTAKGRKNAAAAAAAATGKGRLSAATPGASASPSIAPESTKATPALMSRQPKTDSAVDASESPAALTELEVSVAPASQSTQSGSSGAGGGDEFDAIIRRLENLKRKLTDIKNEESRLIEHSKARLEHLRELESMPLVYDSQEYTKWSQQRLDRMIVEYLLRNGFINTAKQIVEDQQQSASDAMDVCEDDSIANGHKTYSLAALTDVDLLSHLHSIESEIASGNSSSPIVLQWLNENRASLKKSKSDFEFYFRRQEAIQLIMDNRPLDAVAHIRKHLSTNWHETHLAEIKQCMLLLAFKPTTNNSSDMDIDVSNDKNVSSGLSHLVFATKLDKLLGKIHGWKMVAELFRRETYSIYGLGNLPALQIALQAGLSVLKTNSCTSSNLADRSIDCPVCDTAGGLSQLAAKLPRGHHVNSALICRITGEAMTGDNPPMRLPNGYVYSLNALKAMAGRDPNSKVRCPRTHEEFDFSTAKKLFVL